MAGSKKLSEKAVWVLLKITSKAFWWDGCTPEFRSCFSFSLMVCLVLLVWPVTSSVLTLLQERPSKGAVTVASLAFRIPAALGASWWQHDRKSSAGNWTATCQFIPWIFFNIYKIEILFASKFPGIDIWCWKSEIWNILCVCVCAHVWYIYVSLDVCIYKKWLCCSFYIDISISKWPAPSTLSSCF